MIDFFRKKNKNAAIELSMTTIVVVVLSVVLLILGFVLVRSVMCGAITATDQINKGITSQINDLFNTYGGEVNCLGGGQPITFFAGRSNYIWCSVKAEEQADYNFVIKYDSGSDISDSDFQKMTKGITRKKLAFSPSTREPQKIFKLDIPKTSREGDLDLTMEVSKGNDLIWPGTLNFEIKQPTAIQGFIC